jgi:hypothetical protein
MLCFLFQLRGEEEEKLDELRKETVIEADGGNVRLLPASSQTTHARGLQVWRAIMVKSIPLLQCYIGRVPISGFSLASDTAYIAQVGLPYFHVHFHVPIYT